MSQQPSDTQVEPSETQRHVIHYLVILGGFFFIMGNRKYIFWNCSWQVDSILKSCWKTCKNFLTVCALRNRQATIRNRKTIPLHYSNIFTDSPLTFTLSARDLTICSGNVSKHLIHPLRMLLSGSRQADVRSLIQSL